MKQEGKDGSKGTLRKQTQPAETGSARETVAKAPRFETVEKGILRERVKGGGGRNPEWAYYARVNIGGRQRWKGPVRTLIMARDLLACLRDEAQAEKHGMVRRDNQSVPTLAEYAPEYLRWSKHNKRSFDRDEFAMKQLVQRFGKLRLSAISPQEVIGFIGELQDEGRLANGTINRLIALLKGVLSHAVGEKKLQFSPLSSANMAEQERKRIKLREPEARNHPVDRDTESKILAAIREPWLNFMVRLAVASGCRQGEILAMRWEHFNQNEGFIVIPQTKNKKPRQVWLPDSMVEELRERRGAPALPIVTLKDGTTSPKRLRVTRAFQRAATKVGRSDLTFHDLRHVCGTRLLHNGAQLNEIAAHLGHCNMYVTTRYAHTSAERMRGIVNKANEPIPAKPEPSKV